MDLANSSRKDSRILVWSLRNLQNFVYNSCLYEFEDVIQAVDDADILAPPQYNASGTFLKRIVENSTRYVAASPLTKLNPYGSDIELAYDYDIYFVTLDFPWSIASINLLKNWRRRCRIAVCYVVEIWSEDLPQMAHFMKFFNEFDLVCVGTYHILDDVQKMADVPCMFLPPGIDTLKFYPDLENEHRAIDVTSLGRRSPTTHEALLAKAAEESFFYYHELTNGSVLRVENHQEHRTLIANLLKNSRYFITNYAKADLPGLIAGEYEIGYRFFEGAASGNVLIGAPPRGDLFGRYFDWEDSIIPVNFDEPDIVNIIAELDSQPAYLKKIRTQNVANSLLKHDWVYRWEQVLNELEMPLPPAMEDRKRHLKQLADNLLKPEMRSEMVPALASAQQH